MDLSLLWDSQNKKYKKDIVFFKISGKIVKVTSIRIRSDLMKTEHAAKFFTVVEIGKQYATCQNAKGEEIELARYKLPLEAVVGSRLYQDEFEMYKIIREK